MSKEFQLISDVSPGSSGWTVKVVVAEKFSPRIAQKSPTKYQNLLLMDTELCIPTDEKDFTEIRNIQGVKTVPSFRPRPPRLEYAIKHAKKIKIHIPDRLVKLQDQDKDEEDIHLQQYLPNNFLYAEYAECLGLEPICNTDVDYPYAFRNNRFKIVNKIVKELWIIKTIVENYSACLLGKALNCYYYKCHNYLEIDVNIVSSAIATTILRLALECVAAVTVDMSFLVEALSEEKLL
ncbi:protein of unknown function-containing protein [Forsythia ovata]|uniref:Protein ENHANCED DISEASE RESISTANCE 2 C-terminal domain-containing protein n=1 Tax=Forsythia ovata TaxID=205694 RepID=A0ABD1VIU1_9LAMI